MTKEVDNRLWGSGRQDGGSCQGEPPPCCTELAPSLPALQGMGRALRHRVQRVWPPSGNLVLTFRLFGSGIGKESAGTWLLSIVTLKGWKYDPI